LAQADLEALRGVIATAFENVYVNPDGTIAVMTPGVRMAHPATFITIGDETAVGADAPLDPPMHVDDDGLVVLDHDCHAIPFGVAAEAPATTGETIGYDTSRTL
jgi:hypothetical protein